MAFSCGMSHIMRSALVPAVSAHASITSTCVLRGTGKRLQHGLCKGAALGTQLESLPNELLKPERVLFSWPCLAGVCSRVRRARKPQNRSRSKSQRLWCGALLRTHC